MMTDFSEQYGTTGADVNQSPPRSKLIVRLEDDANTGCYTLIKYEHKELLAALRAVPSPDTSISEDERHAIAHARFQFEHATVGNSDCCFDYELVGALLRVIDRKFPSPDTVGVRKALEQIKTVCKDNANAEGWAAKATIDIVAELAIAALSPTHCTSARREETIEECAKEAERLFEKPGWSPHYKNAALTIAGMIRKLKSKSALSEQSGPTAGSRSSVPSNCAPAQTDGTVCDDTPSPPDRQQDQDETSVLPRGADAEPVAWEKLANEMIMSLGSIKLGVIDQYELRTAMLTLMRRVATPPVSDASREALKKCRDAIRSLYREIDNPNMPACLAAAWESAEAALTNSFDISEPAASPDTSTERGT